MVLYIEDCLVGWNMDMVTSHPNEHLVPVLFLCGTRMGVVFFSV